MKKILKLQKSHSTGILEFFFLILIASQCFASIDLLHPGRWEIIRGDFHESKSDNANFLRFKTLFGDSFDVIAQKNFTSKLYTQKKENFFQIPAHYSLIQDSKRLYHVLMPFPDKKNLSEIFPVAHKEPQNFTENCFLFLEPPFYSWEDLDEELQEPARDFLVRYLTYARKLDHDARFFLEQWLFEAKDGEKKTFEILVQFSRWKAYLTNFSLAHAWQGSLIRFKEIWLQKKKNLLQSENLYLHIVKNDFMIYLVDKRTNKMHFAFPMAYGINPENGTKLQDNDYLTPESGTGFTSWNTTPLFISRRVGTTLKPGMTKRCLGIGSSRPEDQFWVKWGMNVAIHGTPNFSSLGSRASHGCIRMLEDDVSDLYDLVSIHMPVVIE